MENDTISRQAAIDAAIEAADEWDGGYSLTRAEMIENKLKDLPSAQSEIVRCKDCEHFKRNIPCVGGVYDGCDELTDDGNEMPVDENFYCGYAGRRTDGKN